MKSLSIEDTFENIGFGRFQYILVLICGIIQLVDALEMQILALLKPILRCVWSISSWDESFLITGVFIGLLLGCPILGQFCDIYGRKPILLISSFSLTFMALLCAASPSIVWITILRAMVGAFLGGVLASLGPLASELMPITNRGSGLIVILAFYPLGSYFVTILCVTIVPTLGWRSFLGLSTIPVVLGLPLLLWLPESPRFLLLKNRKEESLDVINRIADTNKAERVKDVNMSSYPNSSSLDIFHPNYISTTLITSFLWFVSGLTYYGIILIIAKVGTTPWKCFQSMSKVSCHSFNTTSTIDDSCCIEVSWENSKDAIISTTGELIFLPLTIIMIHWFGRKYSIALFSFITAILFVILNICMSSVALSIVLLITRGSISSIFNINYIYASEVFPTSVRSVALGFCTVSSRMGAIMSPFIINFILMGYSFLTGTVIFVFFNLTAFVLALMLPYETKGRPLYQTAEEFKESIKNN